MAKQIELQLVRSPIGTPQWMRVVVRSLGLKKLNSKKVVGDNNAIRGMVKKVSHLVNLKEL